jgi:hypothetical protein
VLEWKNKELSHDENNKIHNFIIEINFQLSDNNSLVHRFLPPSSSHSYEIMKS